jgi:hypothetical protein
MSSFRIRVRVPSGPHEWRRRSAPGVVAGIVARSAKLAEERDTHRSRGDRVGRCASRRLPPYRSGDRAAGIQALFSGRVRPLSTGNEHDRGEVTSTADEAPPCSRSAATTTRPAGWVIVQSIFSLCPFVPPTSRFGGARPLDRHDSCQHGERALGRLRRPGKRSRRAASARPPSTTSRSIRRRGHCERARRHHSSRGRALHKLVHVLRRLDLREGVFDSDRPAPTTNVLPLVPVVRPSVVTSSIPDWTHPPNTHTHTQPSSGDEHSPRMRGVDRQRYVKARTSRRNLHVAPPSTPTPLAH